MRTAILFLILIFSLNVFLMTVDINYIFGSFNVDPILHLFGAFFIAMFFADYLKHMQIGNPGSPRLKRILILISVVVFIGVLWEFSEYLATNFFGNYLYSKYKIICCMGNLDDTISDLMMDTIGAVTFVLAFRVPSKTRSRQE